MKNITEKTLQNIVDELCADLAIKGVVGPSAQIQFESGAGVTVLLRGEDLGTYDAKGFYNCDSMAEGVQLANDYIEALPSPQRRVENEYLRRLAHAVDYATENAIGEKHVAPLRAVSLALTENLLEGRVE